MKANFRKLALGLAIGATLLAPLLSQAVTVAPTRVKVVAFNDLHGTLQSPGNFSVQPGGPGTALVSKPAGGVDYLAGFVTKLKAQNANNVVVSAGDLIGASPLISAFFHDEGTIETVNRLGLEFDAVGNHEFDEGKSELLRMQSGGCHPTDPGNSCKGASVGTPVPFEGAQFKFLSANVIDTTTGKPLFAPYGIKTFAGNLRVAFIGMTLKGTPSIVTPAGVAGLSFHDEADTVNSLIPKLRARGVKAIVVLMHQGGFQGSNTTGSIPNNYINDCKDSLVNSVNSPVLGIVNRLSDEVDLVITGHTHSGYNCRLPNSVGRLIPVTQAGAFGRVLTDIDMDIDPSTGDVINVAANNIVVDRSDATVTPSAPIQSIVNGYNALVSPLANQVIGTITAAMPNVIDSAGEMPAGDLIADSQLAATKPSNFGAAQLAFMNPGGVRNPGFNTANAGYPHDVTYQEAFTVQPFGNSLVTMTLSAQQIKNLLEQQFVGCNGQIQQRVLQVSNGFSYQWSQTGSCGTRVRDVKLTSYDTVGAVLSTDVLVDASGAVLNPTQTYRVTVNNFLSTGGDNFSVLTGGSNTLGGAQDIDAMIAYLSGFKAPHPAYNPADLQLHKPRIVRVP